MKIVPPVIIIGMSRSGTNILTRMLEALGLLVGEKKDRNHEAIFFLQLNVWLLGQCSGGLENPSSIRYLLEDKEARALFADFIRYIMKTPKAVSFLGLRKYMRYGTPANLDIPWGWKDPRNTYTLPIWLDLFPEAKVIHIYRHGVDVANSLRVRREKGLLRLKERHAWIKPLYWFYLMMKFIPTNRKFIDLRCASMEEGLSMWEEYVNEARTHVRKLGDMAIEVKYEDLLTEPNGVLKHLAEFCNLQAGDKDIERVALQIKRERAYAYRSNPELETFAAKMAERLRAQGY
ncbi:MAG TPA: sulfotransferase [Thermodesulfobacteriota bacterium]|nr:sulfotransferase [Thermodesulfobacteriota bacterium]